MGLYPILPAPSALHNPDARNAKKRADHTPGQQKNRGLRTLPAQLAGTSQSHSPRSVLLETNFASILK